MKNIIQTSLAAAALAVSGCATMNPPSELVAARIEYAQAQASSTATDNPAGLYEAKKSLNTANQAFEDDPEGQETRDFSYIALRKVQIANAQAQLDRALATKAQATVMKQKQTEAALDSTKKELTGAREQQKAVVDQLVKTNDQLAKTKEELEKEKVAREAAEARANQTAEALAKISAVKRDERGTVLSLSGSLLFVSGQANLLPGARAKLDEVAAALMASRSGGFVVEGHTDSQGSESFNQDLSERRALAVRDYLVSRGVPAEEVKSIGYGKNHPIAENSTPEGRANNRRVEIVVRPEAMLSAR